MADILPSIPQEVWNRIEVILAEALFHLGGSVQELLPQSQSQPGSRRINANPLLVYQSFSPFMVYRTFNYNQGVNIIAGVTFIQWGLAEMSTEDNEGRLREIFPGSISVRATIYRGGTGQFYLEKEDISIPSRDKDLLAITNLMLVPTIEAWAAPLSSILMLLADRPPKDIITTWIRAAEINAKNQS
jgi:hypothetical protein